MSLPKTQALQTLIQLHSLNHMSSAIELHGITHVSNIIHMFKIFAVLRP